MHCDSLGMVEFIELLLKIGGCILNVNLLRVSHSSVWSFVMSTEVRPDY